MLWSGKGSKGERKIVSICFLQSRFQAEGCPFENVSILTMREGTRERLNLIHAVNVQLAPRLHLSVLGHHTCFL